MSAYWDPGVREDPLTVSIALTLLSTCLFVLAGLTTLTHLTQFLKLPFRLYASLGAATALSIVVPVVADAARRLRPTARDILPLAALLTLGALGAWLSTSFHRVGRISPDEYYSAASPVYLIQHPEQGMGFENRLFYSRESVQTVAFLTAGAYEYAQAAFAFVTGIQFARVYYVGGAALVGGLIPLSLFVLIFVLSGNINGSLLGAFVSMSAMTLMGETTWAPATNSFLRAFEGKAMVQFVGSTTFGAFALLYLALGHRLLWLRLFALCTAMVGASTTSLAMMPLLGVTILGAFLISLGRQRGLNRHLRGRIGMYVLCFAYITMWGVWIAARDGSPAAEFFNQAYPVTFAGYARDFVYGPFPLTAVLVVAGPVLAVALTRGTSRRILMWWVILAGILVLNPLAATIWIRLFRGIYGRFIYLLPFLVSIGLVAGALHGRISAWKPLSRGGATAAMIFLFLVLPLVAPTSIFRLKSYARGNTLYDADLQRAAEIIRITPPGLMLAPWPLSGAISMLDSDRPQLLTRSDIMHFYLGRQGRTADADIRDAVQALLDAGGTGASSLTALLNGYPEIRTIVLDRSSFALNQGTLHPVLAAQGFVRMKGYILGTVVFVR